MNKEIIKEIEEILTQLEGDCRTVLTKPGRLLSEIEVLKMVAIMQSLFNKLKSE